jgi:hypothetical protein
MVPVLQSFEKPHMRIAFPLVFLLLAAHSGLAQLKKTLHQTFELPDSATCLIFQLYEDDGFTYTILPWAGNNIMAESKISVYKATQGIFNRLLADQRYELEAVEGKDTLAIRSFDLKRVPLRYEGKLAIEEGEVRIFIPDEFKQTGPYRYVRPKREATIPAELGLTRRKLERERGEVSQELKEALQAKPDSLQPSSIQPQGGKPAAAEPASKND